MADSSSASSSSQSPSPAPPAETSDVEREEMLDRMLTRLALADDDKLEPLLSRVLPYSISSLASSSPSVRKLVMEILSHANKRVKHQPDIGLPTLELWKIYKEPNAVLMVRSFCIVYLEMSFERLTKEDKAALAPDLLVGIGKFPPQHQGIILRIVAKVIGECHSSQVAESIGMKYQSLGDGKDSEIFIEFCFHTMLYQPPPPGIGCPAGLSVSQSDRVSGKVPLQGDNLMSRKLGILNVVEAMELAPELVYPVYLTASSDSREPVVKRGEDLLKRRAAGVDLENSEMIKRLFILFNGSTGSESTAVESRVTPASIALRIRLMTVFCRSITAANTFPSTLQCIFGCIFGNGTTLRLKQMGMEFTVWVFKHARTDQLKLMGPVILSGILRSLDGSNTESEAITKDVKMFAYQAIGLLASRMPHLFREKVDMVVRLFSALKFEDQFLRLTIQDSITSLAGAYKGATEAVLTDIEALLLENAQVEHSEVRFCAVRWATSLFKLNHCPSRYICMLGAADPKLDIREMALEGLKLIKEQDEMSEVNADFTYPDLTVMLHYITNQQPKLLDSTELVEGKLLFPSKTYVVMIKFLMKCFEADFRSSKPSFVETETSWTSVVTLSSLLEHAMAFEGTVELHATASKALVDIGARLPQLVATRYADRLSWLKPLLSHIDPDTRVSASRLFGVACSALPSSAICALISEISSSISNMNTLRFENHHGSICAIGYIVAEYANKPSNISDGILDSTVNLLVHVIESESSALASIGMEALGHIGVRRPLPLLNRNSVPGGVLVLLQERLSKLLSGEDSKATQKILISLGHISVKETSLQHLSIALDLIFGLCRSKVEEVLFAAGEALTFIWGGLPVPADVILKSNYISLSQSSKYLSGEMSSSVIRTYLSENNAENEARVAAQEVIRKKLFDNLLFSSRKEERCAGTVWLVSLIMYCGYHPKIQQLLPEIQETFSHLLGESNDLTQELASQGMSIVYELGDSSTKDSLVTALVSTLTGSAKRKRAIKLMDDSEVFQEGSIGESASGGKLSTYKELCNLANEMGKPDLIYKFMDLANYQAALNSKRGAAFGFSKIAKQAGDALQPHLRTLIPRLIRYQYDPDKNVQDAMGHIWKSIVADPKATVDEYFDSIVDDLLLQSGSRLWRSREASCLALADIIQGRKFSQVSKYLSRIWTAAFRAMDDIKETVRNSGDSLCRAVSSLTVRLCDTSLTSASDASQTMNIVLPFLLVEGIVSKVSSVQKASTTIVMKLAKNAGIALRPHLPDLVSCMLECLSSLEDQRLNYVEMHAINVGIQAEKLDNLRIAVAKDSPMWETLDLCLNVVDAHSLDSLVPRLAQLVRSGVGLNTRVGVANFITLLVQKVSTDIKPFTGMLLRLAYHAALQEKSGHAKRAFAAACAVILKHASTSQAQKLIEDTSALQTGDRNAQMSCAVLIKAYSNLAPDVIHGYHAIIIPVNFISRFEDDKDISSLFEELWEENSTSERITLQLYLAEIITLICDCIVSSTWASKRKSAKSIRKLSEILGESLSPHVQNLLNILLQELSGRLWEGKDAILYAISSLCSSCHDAISMADPSLPHAILTAMSSACSKKVKSYREAAFSCLQQVVRAFKKPEFFNVVFPMLYEFCGQAAATKTTNNSTNSAVQTGEDNAEDISVPLEKVLDCVASLIQVGHVEDILKNSDSIINIFRNSLSPGLNWTVKMSAFSSIKELCLKLKPMSEGKTTHPHDMSTYISVLFHSVAPLLVDNLLVIKISQVMEILSHVNKRVKHQPDIGLPTLELWKIYKEPNAVLMVRSFCIVYLEMSFERLTKEDKAALAPDLLVGIGKFPPQHQGIILRIVAKVIGECHSSQVAESIGMKYQSLGDGKDSEIFIEFCFHTMLYQPPPPGIGCPAGLSVSQSDRVSGKVPLQGDNLMSRKLGILNVVEAMELAPELVYPVYLTASSDSREPVVKRGEDLLKRRAAGVDLENSEMIKRLFILFNGSTGSESTAVESRVTPASIALRIRLMTVFCRSITAANTFPSTLQCIFGCIFGNGTTLRLKQMGMEFTVWVFKHARTDQLKLMGPVILSGILRSLDGSNTESEAITKDVKMFAYQAIGLLASRMPHLFREKVDMVVRLFSALKFEDQFLRLTIQDSITSLAGAYKGATEAVLTDIEALLLENAQVEHSEVRFCAVRWATSLFKLNHCPSRYICMLGAADPKLDIREMALEGLKLIKEQDEMSEVNADFTYPDLTVMLHYITNQQPKLLDSTELVEGKLLFPSKTYVVMIKFLMKCFEADFRSSKPSFVETETSWTSVVTLSSLLEHAMAFEGTVELHATASKALVDIGARLPQLVATRYADRLSWLKPLLSHIDPDTRVSASRLFGVACSALPSSAICALISEISSSISNMNTLRFENHHGSICAIGYIVAEYANKPSNISDGILDSTVNLLVHVIESESSALASIGMEALGHIGVRRPLPLLNRNSVPGGVLVLLQERLSKLLSGEDSKATQKILISLGHISVKETSLQHLSIALDLIFGLCRSKVEEVLFAAGEALTFIWGGLPVPADVILKSNYISLSQSSKYLSGEMSSSVIRTYLSENNAENEARVAAQEVIRKKLFDNLLFSSRKEERCAGTVWLVSLIMYCGYHPKIQQLLPEIQETFSHLLGESNDLTQELASQGMSIVYELGDSSTKDSLVTALVSTLTGSAKRKRAIKLMDDSEVFQEGSIGESASGGKLSTYKELCNLANEMGKPDLIYKFMDLANYQAALNSKRGAAFGFSKIAKQAGDALQPHLRTLIPRLIRYQYDPDKNVQDAMGHIWKSIVADPKATVDEYFDSIVDDLLLQSGSRLWRSREASCLALADIIQGRKFSQVSKYLSRIWTAAFRAMDDIKETVRNSGDSLCRAVSSLTVRLCDTSLTSASDASQTMNIVLPFLLVEGIVSKVSSVQKASTTIVMKLAKNAGIALRPHLPDLVSCMLECLSSLEDQRLNYVEMHAINVGIQAEKLDNLRIAVAKDSPMWETLDLCLNVVDAHSLDSLVPRLAQLVRSGVGLNTRVGVANFITLLVQKVSTDIKPFTGMLLRLAYHAALQEKSGHAKRAFAAACAVILKHASTSQAQKLIEDTSALQTGDRNAQMSCAVLIKAYSNLAPDVIHGYHAIIIPVNFISRFEDDKDISSLFEELWEENSTSERITLQLYLAEIITLICDCIVSSTWASKRKSAKSIRKLSEILGESLSPHVQNLLNILLQELSGRLWEGKDAILYAISSLCSSCHDAISMADPSLPHAILTAMSSACSKKVKSYREAAFSCLQQVVRAFKKPEFFNVVFPMLYEFCGQAAATKTTNNSTNSAVQTGEDNAEDISVPLEKVLDCVASLIQVGHVEDILKNSDSIINIFRNSLSPGLNWTVKMSAFSSIKELCLKLKPMSEGKTTHPHDMSTYISVLFHSVAPLLVDNLLVIKISQVHITGSECLLEMSKLYKDAPSTRGKVIMFKDGLIQLFETEKTEQAKTALGKCIDILHDLENQSSDMA